MHTWGVRLAWVWVCLPAWAASGETTTATIAEVGTTTAAEVATATVAEDAPVAFEVKVKARRAARTPGSAHVLDERALERQDQDDPHRVIAAVPGVYARVEDGVGLRPNIGIRGTNPDRSKKLTLTEDGILFAPAPYSAPAAYFFPNMTRMKEVRVLKGPASIAYGPHTVGGAIDLVTRAIPLETRGAIDVAGGMFGYGKGHGWIGGQSGALGVLIEGLHLREDGFKHLPSADANTGFYRNEWMAKAAYDLGDGGELGLKLGFANERSNETYVGLSDADFTQDPQRRYGISALDQMSWTRLSGVLSHVLRPASGLSLTTRLYRSDLSRTWRKANGFRGASLFDVLTRPDDPRHAVYYELIAGRADTSSSDEVLLVGPNQRDFVAQGADLKLRWDVDTGPIAHKIEAGARLHYDRAERRHSEDGFLLQAGQLVPEGSATLVTAYNEADTIALAAHLTDALSWSDLTITPGVRVEVIRSRYQELTSGAESVRNHAVVLPGVGAFYAIIPELGVLAGVHRGFSPPAPALNTTNSPELSVAYEAGVRASALGLRAEAIGYMNAYSNITDVCTLASGCREEQVDQQFDAGSADIFGLELHLAGAIELGAISLPISAAYTFTRATFNTTFTSSDPIYGRVAAGDEMPYVPAHQLHATLGAEHERFGLDLALSFASGTRESAGREPLTEVLSTEDALTIDLSGRVNVFGPLWLYAHARNLLDAQTIASHRPYGARGGAPRWVQVGVKAEL